MSSSTTNISGAALGVGAIVSESFSILFRNIFSVMLLSLVPTLLTIVISGMLNGFDVALGVGQPEVGGSGYFVRFGLSMVAQLALGGVTTALLVQMAYDAKLNRPIQIGRYIGPALSAMLPIAILGILSGILIGLGTVALILPGLLIYAVYSVMPAAVAIEKVGFSGLGRSAALTKGYRWPIVGAAILIWIVTFVVTFGAMFLVGLLIAGTGGGGTGITIGVLAFAVISSIAAGFGSISVALIYARLREIKEGTSVRDIAAVFD